LLTPYEQKVALCGFNTQLTVLLIGKMAKRSVLKRFAYVIDGL
jgi:hypothetical protein